MFNFGFVSVLKKRNIQGLVFFILSTMFQVTAVLYIGGLITSKLVMRMRRPPRPVFTFVGILLFIFLSTAILLGIAIAFKDGLPEKIAFYVELTVNAPISLWAVAMFVAFTALGLHATFPIGISEDVNSDHMTLRTFVIVLAAITAGALIVPIVRERASYEFWIVYSIYLCMSTTPFKRLATIGAIAFGIAFSGVLFRYPYGLMFLPYQNFLIYKSLGLPSTGQERSKIFFDELNKIKISRDAQRTG